MIKISSADRFVRVFHAAYPYFSRISDVLLSNVRALYPKTSKCLVHLAASIANEEYGESLLDNYRRFSAEEAHLDFSAVKKMLTLEAEKLSSDQRPEILEDSLQLSKETSNSFLQLFEESIENFINLSHLTVKMLLAENMEPQASKIALALHQPVEKSKALLELIHYKILHDEIESASHLYPSITSLSEKRLAAAALVNAWLHRGMIEEAITFSGNIEEETERNHALQEAALCMVKQGDVDEAIALIDCFDDEDAKAYAFSRLVNNLAIIGDFKNAVLIAYSIKEQSYRQDAFTYILNKLISMRRIEDAIEVASLIPGVQERLAAARTIERVLLSHQQDMKIKQLHLKF